MPARALRQADGPSAGVRSSAAAPGPHGLGARDYITRPRRPPRRVGVAMPLRPSRRIPLPLPRHHTTAPAERGMLSPGSADPPPGRGCWGGQKLTMTANRLSLLGLFERSVCMVVVKYVSLLGQALFFALLQRPCGLTVVE